MSTEPRSTNPNSKIDKRLEGWAERSRHQHLRLFSELDVLLRALDRFFSPDGEAKPPADRNYLRELNAAKDVIFRVLAILDAVIPQGSKNAYQFMKFTESSIASPQKRDAFRSAFYKQDTMEQGLFLLYDSFANINGVLMDLLKAKQIPHTSFVNLGELITREIRENVYFNPFRAEIDAELDRIDNHEISAIVRSIKDRRLRNTVSLIFVYLFRILRFLGHTNERLPQRTVSLHVSILILMMLRSELQHFLSYTQNASAAGPELAEVLSSVHYQYTMELRRVYRAEMKGVFEKRTLHQIRSRVENSAGILRNLTEQCLIQVAQIWRPELKGEDIFDGFVTKAEQSTRLREDLYVLKRVLTACADKGECGTLELVMKHFEAETFRLLRYDDLMEIATYFGDLRTISGMATEKAKFAEKCHQLSILACTTIGQVNNRAELLDRPFNLEKAEAVVRQYIPA